MSKLPVSPNLVYLRKQARNLLKALQEGDPEARSRVIEGHPRLSPNPSDAEVEELGLVDVQLVIAREYGFDSWAKMKAHILDATFAAAVEAIGEGDGDRLRALLDAHPDIVDVPTPVEPGDSFGYFSGAKLLHYTAGNPTHVPLSENVMEMMGILLDAGSDVNATTEVGHTALCLVATGRVPRERGIQIPMMELLKRRGANPNVGSPYSALEGALMHGETEASEELYRYGAKLDLRLAAGLGRIDLMEEYFKADGSLKDGAYELARKVHGDCELELTDAEVLTDSLAMGVLNWQFEALDFLLGKGVDINGYSKAVHAEGHTALHFACCGITRDTLRTEPTMVAYLLDRGSDPTIPDTCGVNAVPFDWAVHNGQPKIVKYLMDLGYAGDLKKHLGHAASQGHIGVTQVFLDAGVDPREPCWGDKNSIQIAEENDREDMVAFLKEAAAR